MPDDLRDRRDWKLPLPSSDPTLLVWNRLEGAPYAPDGQLDRALRAEIADGLWMLTRQWQFGELRGEDTGSPVSARLSAVAIRTSEVRSPSGVRTELADDGLVTPKIEAEPPVADLALSIRIGAAWLRGLHRAGLDDLRPAHVAKWPLGPADELEDSRRGRVLALAAGRSLDGVTLLRDLRGDRSVVVDATRSSADEAALLSLADALVATYADVVLAAETSSSWMPDRLEYGATVHAHASDATLDLTLREHTGDGIAWHSFDALQVSGGARSTLSFVPTPAEAPGMPSDRFWAFEDHRVAMTHADLQRTDAAQALFLEYMLVFSNDWAVVPYVVPVGTHLTVTAVHYVDSFGVETEVLPVDDGTSNDPARFSMFQLTRAGDASSVPGLFVAPVPVETSIGPAIEEVWFARDPDVNLAWAAERLVPDGLGGGAPRPAPLAAPPTPAPVGKALYRFGRPPPDGWFPLAYASGAGGARFVHAQAIGETRGPAGVLLQGPFSMHEAELPREGIRVVRAHRRAILPDGTPVIWLGRTVSVGHGEARSGLAYDVIDTPGGLDRR